MVIGHPRGWYLDTHEDEDPFTSLGRLQRTRPTLSQLRHPPSKPTNRWVSNPYSYSNSSPPIRTYGCPTWTSRWMSDSNLDVRFELFARRRGDSSRYRFVQCLDISTKCSLRSAVRVRYSGAQGSCRPGSGTTGLTGGLGGSLRNHASRLSNDHGAYCTHRRWAVSQDFLDCRARNDALRCCVGCWLR